MFCKVTIETEHLIARRIATALKPSVQECASTDLSPMLRSLPVHVVNAEKDRPILAATGALHFAIG
jgi:hypothetical protein